MAIPLAITSIPCSSVGGGRKTFIARRLSLGPDMEARVSGFRVSGDWGEIVEHGERITQALRDAGIDSEAFEAWDDWRPKSHELLDAELREKTAHHASINEGAGEQAGESPNDDLKTAGEKLTESYEKLESDEATEAVKKWQDSIGYVARAADSAGRKALRSVEDAVYRNVMTQVAPYYFDNALISANISRTRNGDEPFALEVNVNEDELKQEVGERLSEYAEEIDRWHVDAEKETESVEAAEGVEAPDSEPNADSTTT